MWLDLKVQEYKDWCRAHSATDLIHLNTAHTKIHLNTAHTKIIFAHTDCTPLFTALLWWEIEDTNMREEVQADLLKYQETARSLASSWDGSSHYPIKMESRTCQDFGSPKQSPNTPQKTQKTNPATSPHFHPQKHSIHRKEAQAEASKLSSSKGPEPASRRRNQGQDWATEKVKEVHAIEKSSPRLKEDWKQVIPPAL